MSAVSTEKVLSALGILVLRRDAGARFRVAGEIPFWYRRLFGEAGDDDRAFAVDERFPFLATFLPTAVNYWASRGSARIRSGQWVETYPSGDNVPLQASALCLEEDDILTIEYAKSVYEQGKGFLQKARDKALEEESGMSRERKALAREQARLAALLTAVGAKKIFRAEAGRRVVAAHPAEAEENLPATWSALLDAKTAADVQSAAETALEMGKIQPIAGDAGRVVPIAGGEVFVLLN